MTWDVWTVSKPCLIPMVVVRGHDFQAAGLKAGGEGSEGTIAAPLHRLPLRLGHLELPVETVREVLDYNPDSGVLVWRARPGLFGNNMKRQGSEAGNINATGYRLIKINRKLYLAHRLAWAHYYGEWPKLFIDHIDRDRLNNSIRNLREATRAQNGANRAKCGKAIAKGVCMEHGKFVAKFRGANLGRFATLEEAAAAYDAAAKSYFGEFALGSLT